MRLPAFTSAHSHAFQRALRGFAQRPRSEHTREDFWSWRSAMFDLAESVTPERLAVIARRAFVELRAAGVETVGEFHYLHHQADGTPYEDRTLLAQVMVEAALEVGLRIAILRAAYHRNSHNSELFSGQRRFCDKSVDDVLCDVADLQKRYRDNPRVQVGVAPHSVRAVPPDWLRPLADYARKENLPFHMHVSEQPAEIESCVAETTRRPVELLADLDVLSPRFVAVHATHLLAHEARLLGQAHAFVCLCPTTERDLGDGLANVAALRDAGTRICVGIDSHVVCAPLEEIRAVETHERLRTLRRATFAPTNQTPAQWLWEAGSTTGALACGFDTSGEVEIDLNDPSMDFVPDELQLDALVFSAPGRVISAPFRPEFKLPSGECRSE